jgi:putative PIN family toxin of toxin-antitoxin system
VYRVVLDTVVFVRALINPKSRSGLLLSDYSDQYNLIISKQTAQELLEVIARPELKKKYKSLGKITPHQVIDILAQAEALEIGAVPPVVRDPKDDIFVATALAGAADYLVTEDKDLLVLGNSLGVSIVDTETFIARLQQEKE